jgi:hypothetical protein
MSHSAGNDIGREFFGTSGVGSVVDVPTTDRLIGLGSRPRQLPHEHMPSASEVMVQPEEHGDPDSSSSS